MPKQTKEIQTTKKSKNNAHSTATVEIEKKSLMKLAITIVVLVALLSGMVGGAVVWILAKSSEPEMNDWAKIYLSHIKTVRENDDSNDKSNDETQSESFWEDEQANLKVSFYETTNNSTPMMMVNYTSVENNLSYNSVAIYSIINEEVVFINYQNSNLFYVLDIENNTYNYYLKSEDDDENTYLDVDEFFGEGDEDKNADDGKNDEAEESPFEKAETICSAKEEADDYCGNIFAEEPVEMPSFDYSPEMSDKVLAEAVAGVSDEYLTEAEVKEQTEEKLQKSATEAEKRLKAKEEAKEYFMVGDQKVRFGKYAHYGDCYVDANGKIVEYGSGDVALTLNPDFTATIDGETTKFEVRPLRHGDVYNGMGCGENQNESCPVDSMNGKIAIVIEQRPSEYNKNAVPITLFTYEQTKYMDDGRLTPYKYDLMPVTGVALNYYRFIGK